MKWILFRASCFVPHATRATRIELNGTTRNMFQTRSSQPERPRFPAEKAGSEVITSSVASVSTQSVPQTFYLERLHDVDLFEIDIESLQRFLGDYRFTCTELVTFCLERIRSVGSFPLVFCSIILTRQYQWCSQIDPYLEAVIEINPDALQIAKTLDEERRAGSSRGMLHGIPVLTKDVSRYNQYILDDLMNVESSYQRPFANYSGLLGLVGQHRTQGCSCDIQASTCGCSPPGTHEHEWMGLR